MTRSSMAFHDTQKCRGLSGCETCLSRVWHGKTPVMTPLLDALFLALSTVAIVGFCLFFAWQIIRLVLR